MITENWNKNNFSVLSDDVNAYGERYVLGSVTVVPGYNFEIRVYTGKLDKEKTKEVLELLLSFVENNPKTA